jgi:DNA-binding NarL/FixJ family response regulator
VSADVLTLLSCGKTQKEVAADLGIGGRTVKHIVALFKKGHLAPDVAVS